MVQEEQTLGKRKASFDYISSSGPTALYLFRPTGDSEETETNDKQFVVVDRVASAGNGDLVAVEYAERKKVEVCVVENGKWFVKDAEGTLRSTEDVAREGGKIVGAVKYSFRAGKGS